MSQRYEQPRPSEAACRHLAQRIGTSHLNLRLGLERDHAVDTFGHGRWFRPENWLSGQRMARVLVRWLGIEAAGRHFARRMRVHTHDVYLPGVSASDAGLRVLHLTDLHLDMATDTVDALIRGLDGVEADLCVLTGDYRVRTYGPIDAVVGAFRRLKPHLPTPCYAVLGNHDCLAIAEVMEDLGIRVLLNESVSISNGDIYLAGIDDPHFYQADNLDKALEGIPAEAAVILLSHSPETYREVACTGVGLMLCGHTHGGQVCLPGGIAVTYDSNCPRRYCRGEWRDGTLQGYTSRGCGTSVLDIRFFCPPEIVLHRLHPAP